MATATAPVAAALEPCKPCNTFHIPLPPGAQPCTPVRPCPDCERVRCADWCPNRYESPDEESR
jgi:hypothetical protein